MSSGNTETRILQMQLENKDFEDGVRQTIKSLEDLEEKLNLKNAGDGFEKVSAAANSVQMSHLESGLDTVTSKFTLMGQIGLQVLERISSKIIDTSEKILRAATIQPMIDGWGEFEMKTNSVQTILGGIRNQFEDQPTAINAISDALNELNEYADKTIYNFAQMTENVGKFTNQGLGLEESTNAIKGIANWAAAVGANPAQMSRAMYNISQSLGAGSMQLIDWRSIRFANMATPEVKKLFAEVAKIQGTLTEDGQIKIGKKTLDVLEDFESSLKGGWLTNEVMAEAFSIYANAYSETELIEKYGEELGHSFYEMGVYAEEAATKVRTFSQLMSVLQEALGSGWANTFELLFGGFEQQTEFLTAIKDRIEQIINFQTEDRNTWLQNFSDVGGIIVFQDTILKTLDILSDFYWVFNDVAALVLNPFGQSVFNMSDGIFGPRQEGYTEMAKTWEGVKGIFDDISDTLDNFRMWLYTPNGKTGRSPIHNLASALSGVAGAAGIAWQVLTGFGKFVFRIFKRFEPLVSAVLDLLGQIGGAIYNVFFNLTGQQSIEKIFDNIEKAVGPVIDVIVGFAAAVVDMIHSFLGIDSAADDWTVLGEKIRAFFDIFKYETNLSFVDNLKNSLKKSMVAIFGEDTANSLIKAWDTNVAPVLEQISGFFDGLIEVVGQKWNEFYDFLFGHEITGKMGNTWREGGLVQIIHEYFSSDRWGKDLESVRSFFDPVIEAIEDAYTKVSNFLFGYDEITANYNGPHLTSSAKHHNGLIDNILQYFSGDQWGKDLKSIRSFFDPAIEALGDAYTKVSNFLLGTDTWVYGGSEKGYVKQHNNGLIDNILQYFNQDQWGKDLVAIGAFFDPVIKALEEAYTKVSNFLNQNQWGKDLEAIGAFFDPAIKAFGDAYTKVSNFLFGYDETVANYNGPHLTSSTKHHNGLIDNLVQYFSQDQWGKDLEAIGAFFDPAIKALEEAYTKVSNFLFGSEKWVYGGSEKGFVKEHQNGLIDNILEYFEGEGWQQAWASIQGAFTEISGWITDNGTAAWNTIMNFLFGPETDGEKGTVTRSGGAYEAAIAFLTPVWDWIQSTGQKLYDYVTTHSFQEMWDSLDKLLFGYDEIVANHNGPHLTSSIRHQDGILTSIIEMLRPISDVFSQIKGWALEKLSSIDWGGIWGSLGKFFNGYDEVVASYDGGHLTSKTVHHEGVFERIAGFFERIIDYFESPEFQEFLGNLKNFYHTYIEPVLNWIGGLGGIIWGGIEGLFSGKGLSGFGDLGTYLSDGINNLIGSLFPEGFNLEGILGGLNLESIFGGNDLDSILDALLGGGNADKQVQDATKDAKSGGGFFDALLGLFIGDAKAAEAEESEILGNTIDVSAAYEKTGKAAGEAIDTQVKTTETLVDKILKFAPLIGGGMLLSKASDVIIGLTGNKKKSIFEVIGEVFRSFGDMFIGLGIFIGAAAIAEKIDPGILDQAFQRIESLLTTIFTWMAIIGGGGSIISGAVDVGGNIALSKWAGGDGNLDFSSVADTIASFGEGLSGIFNGIETLLKLSGIVAMADLIVGKENVDKAINRVLGFIGKVLLAIMGSSTVFTLIDKLENFGSAYLDLKAGVTSKNSKASILLGAIGSFAVSIADAVATLAGAGAIMSITNVDTSKITDIITAVGLFLGSLTFLTELGTLTSLLGDKAGWESFKALALTGGGLAVALGAIGTVAKALFDWFTTDIQHSLYTMAPAFYTFTSNLTGALEMIASLGELSFDQASDVITNKLPELYRAITSDDNGFDKQKFNERSTTIRDFGDRVYNGIQSLARAKDVFDKYNTGNGGFPLEFFQEMTGALQYLQGDGIQELYDNVFGMGGFYVGTNEEREKINGLTTFFSTLGNLGYAITEYSDEDLATKHSGTKLESTKENLDAFRDAFGGIQTTFHSIVDDMSKEGFDIQKINSLGDFLVKISEAGKTFSSNFLYIGNGLQFFEGTSPITQFASWLQTMGTGIRQLNDSLTTNGVYDINYSQLESALNSLKPMAEIEKTLFEYSKVTNTSGKKPDREWMSNTQTWIETVLPKMKEIGAGLHNMAAEIKPEDVKPIEGISGTLSGLAAVISSDVYTGLTTMSTEQIGAYTSTFTSLKQSLLMPENSGSTIASTIQEIMQATGGKPVSLQIVPIVDDSNLGGNLPDGLSMENTYSRMINMSINMEGVQNVRIESAQIDSLVRANHDTRDKIDTLATSIKNIKIQVTAPGGSAYGPRSRTVEVFPLTANYQSPFDDEP